MSEFLNVDDFKREYWDKQNFPKDNSVKEPLKLQKIKKLTVTDKILVFGICELSFWLTLNIIDLLNLDAIIELTANHLFQFLLSYLNSFFSLLFVGVLIYNKIKVSNSSTTYLKLKYTRKILKFTELFVFTNIAVFILAASIISWNLIFDGSMALGSFQHKILVFTVLEILILIAGLLMRTIYKKTLLSYVKKINSNYLALNKKL